MRIELVYDKDPLPSLGRVPRFGEYVTRNPAVPLDGFSSVSALSVPAPEYWFFHQH
ncbi:hypothetical protein [Xenorhabdus bovienii]|uniref:hypothetical protein n=1 Tax=Xenorhabdus bovienii TaxID=40576 RepID=UPI0023B2C87B|nr:hypothetical protein [Xenorhabdus bovienii]